MIIANPVKLLVIAAALLVHAWPLSAQTLAERRVPTVEITQGEVRPTSIAFAAFFGDSEAALSLGNDVVGVVVNDLTSTGLFVNIDPGAFVEEVSAFGVIPTFEDWSVINVPWLVTGEVLRGAEEGQIAVQFRLWDVLWERQAVGLQLVAAEQTWRRVAHRMADAIYSAITREEPYFDSRIAFVEETGPKDNRRKRLALMDQDGANIQYLTGTGRLSMTPRFSPTEQRLTYIGFERLSARVFVADIETGERTDLGIYDRMSFAPRFSPDGKRMALSITDETGNSDIYLVDIKTKERTRLTFGPEIDTSPSFSPDGSKIVFVSDRGDSAQLYLMESTGGETTRISWGDGAGYGTPVWSPRGDYIAFTKQRRNSFHIGIMRTDGTGERELTGSFHDEAPTWSPNGRVLMFFREYPGSDRLPKLFTIDVSGRNLRTVQTPQGASDPAWSPLLE